MPGLQEGEYLEEDNVVKKKSAERVALDKIMKRDMPRTPRQVCSNPDFIQKIALSETLNCNMCTLK